MACHSVFRHSSSISTDLIHSLWSHGYLCLREDSSFKHFCERWITQSPRIFTLIFQRNGFWIPGQIIPPKLSKYCANACPYPLCWGGARLCNPSKCSRRSPKVFTPKRSSKLDDSTQCYPMASWNSPYWIRQSLWLLSWVHDCSTHESISQNCRQELMWENRYS